MVPTAWRNQKKDLKNQVSQIIATIRGYESCTMTQKIANKLKELYKELRKQFTVYWDLWYDILSEMERENATQEECDIEREEEFHMVTEQREAVKVIDIKLQEWKDQEKLEQDKGDKSLLLLSQQQQQHTEKRIQDLQQLAAALNDTISAAAGSGASSTKLHQRWSNDIWEEEQRRLNERWKEFLMDSEPKLTNNLLLTIEQLHEANLHLIFSAHLDHPEVQALIGKQRTKIRELIDVCETEGKKIEKTSSLLSSSSHEKRKKEESNLECLEIKEEHDNESTENLFKRQVVSKDPEVNSANQFFSPPGRPATTLEELADGFSPVFTKEDIPELAQHQVFTTEQETFPISCITTQPLSTGETAVTIWKVSTTTLECLTEGASIVFILEEVPSLTLDHSDNQQNIPSESIIQSAEPIEGANQQVAPIPAKSNQHQQSSAKQTNIERSEVQPSSLNHNSKSVSSLGEQQVISLNKPKASPDIQLLSALSDSIADEVINEEITPQFRTPSGTTTNPKVLSKQNFFLKQKRLERVNSILQLYNKSSKEEKDLSLNKSVIQVLTYFSQPLKNSLVKKVTEEYARIHQLVWDPGGLSKLRVHQLLLGATTKGWRISMIKSLQSSQCPAGVQPRLSIRRSSRMERALPGSMLGIYGVTNSDRLTTMTSALYWKEIVYIFWNPHRGLHLFHLYPSLIM